MKKCIFFLLLIFTTTAIYFVIHHFDKQPINQSTKTCLITGASSGLGYELSREMIKRKWKVIGVARRAEKLKDIAQELGSSLIPYTCDESKPEQVHNVSHAIKQQGLQPTLFFLNAGTGDVDVKFKPMLNNHKQMFDTNYFGTLAWIDEWINDLKKWGGGTFVATSSVASIFGGTPGYCASKAAINASFNALRRLYYNDNIGFVLVLPGPIATEMLKTPKPLPFTHKPADDAQYIVEHVFKGDKQIEPSWFYSILLRMLSWLPDYIALKLL